MNEGMDFQLVFPLKHLPFWVVVGAALLACAALLLRRLENRRTLRLHRFVEAALAPRLMPGYDASLRRPLIWLTLAGFGMLGLTLAQPRWGKAWIEVERGSRDILVLLDTSESMNARDAAPTRLEQARQKVIALLERSPADRFGLITFSGGAVLQCPLTLDHAYFRTVLDAVDTDSLSAEGTDIAAALAEARKALAQEAASPGEERRLGRAVIVFSDGEAASDEAVTAARRLGRNATLFVVGVGTEEGAPVQFPSWMLAQTGSSEGRPPHHSRLDEGKLAAIARAGNGTCLRSTADPSDVEGIRKGLAGVTARSVSGALRFTLMNRYRWPLLLAIACFAGEGLWRVLLPWVRLWRTRRGRTGTEAINHG